MEEEEEEEEEKDVSFFDRLSIILGIIIFRILLYLF